MYMYMYIYMYIYMIFMYIYIYILYNITLESMYVLTERMDRFKIFLFIFRQGKVLVKKNFDFFWENSVFCNVLKHLIAAKSLKVSGKAVSIYMYKLYILIVSPPLNTFPLWKDILTLQTESFEDFFKQQSRYVTPN